MNRIIKAGVVLIVLAAVIFAGMKILGSPPSNRTTNAQSGHGAQEEHSDGVSLNDAKVAAAGIELLKAGPVTLRDTIVLNGMIQPNQEALVQVSPRFPGIVREVNRRVGEAVNKNDLLAKVESNQSLTIYDLRSPIAGTIIDRQVALGEYVTEQKAAFTVADLSMVWVDLSVFRRDMKRVRVKDKVLIDAGDGGEPIEAAISYISPVGSADTQSSLARVIVSNAEQRLRPGLFVSAKLILSAKAVPVAVKLSALQTIENRTVVFVREGDKFQPRDVELGERDGESVDVIFGVTEGETYAGKNSFIVKAELAKSSATHDH